MVFGEILAGFIATAVMTIVMVYLGPMMGMMPKNWNIITDGLGGMMNRMMGVSKSMGWLAHFTVGTILHPFVFALIWQLIFSSLLGGASFYVYVLVFAVMMIMMFPMLGVPSDFKSKMMMGVIVVHLIYAVTYIYTLPLFNF